MKTNTKIRYELPLMLGCSAFESDIMASSLVVPVKVQEVDVIVEPFEKVKSAEGTEYFEVTFE